ncbi:hypothetical protein CPLU01_02606 [Colletotrichum plurivorum]|uniref:Secreted protein n=1 Tax=Colletotrichum plurivorum TaxID=2175906 RepID=A0A8H6KVU4_9PEZI|nr:hypothetical protein CPLU01_02606 [Colletotrichum plurivorum]
MNLKPALTGLVALALAEPVLGETFADAFSNPPNQYRPKFRYWIPDASADVTAVREDIHAIADVGAGGFEFLPYYQFGYQATDWSEYGYGTEAFRPIFRAAMEAADERHTLMDFAIGANQGQGVPAPPETPGLAVHLTYSNFTLGPGESYNGTLALSNQPSDPSLEYFMHTLEGFGDQKLIAVLAVAVSLLSHLDGEDNTGYTKVTSVVDLTSSVSPDSRSLSWTAPKTENVTSWRIMAWYQRFTNQRSIDPGSNPTTYLQNGSWIVDHFSAAGSELREAKGKTDKDFANLAWEDSMEMNAGVWWTPGFDEKFRQSRGYDVQQCLPFLLSTVNSWAQQVIPYGEGFESVNRTISEKCIDDYRIVLQEGYKEYAGAHVEWSRARGARFSNQPAYNLPLSAIDTALLVDAPEVESYGFKDKIDSYKFFSGPARLAGNPVVSSECGAVPELSYTQKLEELLRSVHRGLAGGVSMNVFHGFPYSGSFANTTWPGVTIFAYRFTEMWGPRQPLWDHMPSFMDYVGRNQFILQSGTPKVDLAFYKYGVPYRKSDGYDNDNLNLRGYTYDFLGPASLESDRATVCDGILAADGPAYKALVFSNQTKIPLTTATRVKELALSGLPLFFVGNETLQGVGTDLAQTAEVEATLRDIMEGGLPNVAKVPSADELIAALTSSGLFPNAALPNDGSARGWFTFWRSTEDAEIIWLYNDGANGNSSDTVQVTFSGVGTSTPYVMDAWTGAISPVLQYVVQGGDIVVPVSLQANQSTLISFQKEPSGLIPPPKAVVTSTSGSPVRLASRATADGTTLLAAQSDGGMTEITLSDGRAIRLSTTTPERTTLEQWDIQVEDWHRTDNASSVDKEITVFEYPSSPLMPWAELDAKSLTNVSGIGRYSTNFTTPTATEGRVLGARLHLGKQEDSTRVKVNGVDVALAGFSQGISSSIDISAQVNWPSNASSVGNELTVEVATTLLNRIRSETNITWSMGTWPDSSLYAAKPLEKHGLQGPVWIEWLEMVDLA